MKVVVAAKSKNHWFQRARTRGAEEGEVDQEQRARARQKSRGSAKVSDKSPVRVASCAS
jgi:hypothetical protein